MKKKNPYRDFTMVLKFNRYVVLTIIVGAILLCVLSVSLAYKLYSKTADMRYAISTDGTVIPLKLLSKKEDLEVELKAHISLFHNYFYSLDPTNYEQNIEKSLWLGGDSVTELYKEKQSQSFYNKIVQFSLIQKIEEILITIDLNQEPYPFKVKMLLSVQRGEVIDQYVLETSGKIIEVSRNYPLNPHGLLITSFFEGNLTRYEEQKR